MGWMCGLKTQHHPLVPVLLLLLLLIVWRSGAMEDVVIKFSSRGWLAFTYRSSSSSSDARFNKAIEKPREIVHRYQRGGGKKELLEGQFQAYGT